MASAASLYRRLSRVSCLQHPVCFQALEVPWTQRCRGCFPHNKRHLDCGGGLGGEASVVSRLVPCFWVEVCGVPRPSHQSPPSLMIQQLFLPVGGATAPPCGLEFLEASQARGRFGFPGPPAAALCPLMNQYPWPQPG